MVSKTGVLACALALVTGCEWGSDGGFNTSRGAGAQINYSGVYRGNGGALVAGRPVNSLTIQQVGDSIEVTDNNGSSYRGRVGSPGVVGDPDLNGNYGRGATMLQSQISFSGVNAATGTNVRFSGMVRVVAVSEVRGRTSETSQSESEEGEIRFLDDEDPTLVTERTIRDSRSSSSGTTYAYTVTESNSNYILEGSWNEGGVSAVNGVARAASGIFAVVTTAVADSGNGGGNGATP